MTEIIKVTAEHIPRIVEIERACFTTPWSEKSLLFEAEHPYAYFNAASEDGNILGFCILHRMHDEGELYNIAVDDAYRRRGVASLILNDALNNAERNGVRRVFLEVRRSNAAARALYLKHGFEVCGMRKNYYTDPVEDAMLMMKELETERKE